MSNLLSNAGFETEALWIPSSDRAFVCLDEPELAHSGQGFAKIYSRNASTGSSIRLENIMLEAGASYLLTYYIRPVSSIALIPALNVMISYLNDAGQSKLIQESPKLTLVPDAYMQKRFFFTIPQGSSPVDCRVAFSLSPHKVDDEFVCVDDVSLEKTSANDFPQYGRYAWITNVGERIYTEAAGSELALIKNTNDYVVIYARREVDGETWYMVRDVMNRFGWIEERRLTWAPPQIPAGKKYVVLDQDRVWPKNRQQNRMAYYWPRGRRVLVKDHDETTYEARYGGQIAYLDKSTCTDTGVTVVTGLDARAAYLAGGEVGRSNSRYFDNAQGNWSEAFAESVVMSAGVPRTDLPCVSDPEKAIIFWMTSSTYSLFYFWDVETKRAFKAKYPDRFSGLSNDLSITEQNSKPTIGRLLYFVSTEDSAETGVDRRLASYVGVITEVRADAFDLLYVDQAGGPVRKAVYPIDWRGAIGMAFPRYIYISATQLP